MRLLASLALLFLPQLVQAQLRDDFADGNFTAAPIWGGDVGSFQVVGQQLQSNGPAVTGSQVQLSTACRASTGTTWEFWANLRLATSSGNLADVWLMATQPDLRAAATAGYFVRLGGTADNVSLFRKDSARTAVAVITGATGTLASATNNLVRVRVTRSVANVWTLERDLTGGRSFVAETGSPATDAVQQRSAACGINLLYSSANGRNFYFDDFVVSDATAPLLRAVRVLGPREVEAVFNESLDPATASAASNYRLGSGAGAVTAVPAPNNPAVVRLTFGADFVGANTLEVRGVADEYGNVAAGPLVAGFTAPPSTPRVGDLIISELLADEDPAVGLPASEYVEIFNRSPSKTLSLRGVRLGKGSSATYAVLPDTARLLPGQYAIICGSTRTGQFAGLGKVYGPTNFPALSNGGDQLLLRGPDGRVLFELSYSDTWYGDPAKKNGGWSLEMKDLDSYCAGASNWAASRDASGGTPGRRNSVAAPNPDTAPPTLLRAVAVSASTIRLFFAEKLDSAAAANPARYRLEAPGPAVAAAAPLAPDFRTVDLALAAPLLPSRPVTLVVLAATDCAGNASGALPPVGLALPEAPQPGDLVLNEILFNPRPYGVDFVEIRNRSTKYLNVGGLQIARIRDDGTADAEVLPAAPRVLAPGQVLALTTDAAILQSQYPASTEPAAVLTLADLPTLPDDVGTVALFGPTGQELDRYTYDKAQHLSLLGVLDGVSLERIRAEGASVAANFHSAAGAVGYATPGRPNSQDINSPDADPNWAVSPAVFTPDDDGQQDLTTLNYRLDQPGYVASVTVYDALGRPVRRLVRNQSLPTTGFVQWDGTDERGRKADVGYYIFVVETFRPGGGERQELKREVVLGARL